MNLENLFRDHYRMRNIASTIKCLLDKRCGICIYTSLGPAFLSHNRPSTQQYVEQLERYLGQKVIWFSQWQSINITSGKIYLAENSFMDERDVYCDQQMVNEILAKVDMVVFDGCRHLDARYASSLGLIEAGVPKYLGHHFQKITECRKVLKDAKIGALIGGGHIAWQLSFIKTYIDQIKFVAVGGQVGPVFMGLMQFRDCMVHQDLFQVISLLRKRQVKVIYPVDVVVYSESSHRSRACLYQDIEKHEEVMDIAKRSRERILSYCKSSAIDFIVFSDPMGHYIDPRYARNTDLLVKDIGKIKKKKLLLGRSLMKSATFQSVTDQYDYIFQARLFEKQLMLRPNPRIERCLLL